MDMMFRSHEFILLLYFLSLSVLSYDLFFRNRQARKVSFYLVGAGAILHIFSFVQIGLSLGRFPIQTVFEGIYVLSMLLVIIGIVQYKRSDSEIAFAIYVFTAFLLLSMYTFAPVTYDEVTEVSAIMNDLLVIHVVLSLLSYVMFFISVLHAGIYIIQYDNLKKKRFNRLFFSLFSVETAKKMMIRTAILGFLFILIGIFLGIQWGLYIFGTDILTDLKVLGTLIVLILYGGLLSYLSLTRNIYKFAVANIVIFIICMMNYLFITQLSSFHFWNY
ncbi:cytochrome c biogenesis protein CcsA [Salinicoccus siamensis]|uniref:Cytochrome c biogenesis protein CcsA n=1 Tax=Salinicoccus siamensis TaxID=381830 RepID=A0ABV5Z0Y5_9STAP